MIHLEGTSLGESLKGHFKDCLEMNFSVITPSTLSSHATQIWLVPCHPYGFQMAEGLQAVDLARTVSEAQQLKRTEVN